MKRSFLLFTVAAGIGYLSLSSYSSGPATMGVGNRTGSPGSSGTCSQSGCHGAPNANTTASFSMIADVTAPSVPVTSYIAGRVYEVTIVGNHPNNNNCGFQAIVLNSSNAQVGSVTATDSRTTKPNAFASLIEQKQSIPKTGGSFTIKYNWTAPTTPGTGTVTFYGVLNATNNVPGADAGDHPSSTFNLQLTENIVSSVSNLAADVKVSAFPNPAKSQLTLKLDGAETGMYAVTITDIAGRIVAQEQIQVSGNEGQKQLNISHWAAGLHFARIMKDGAQRTISVVKQ